MKLIVLVRTYPNLLCQQYILNKRHIRSNTALQLFSVAWLWPCHIRKEMGGGRQAGGGIQVLIECLHYLKWRAIWLHVERREQKHYLDMYNFILLGFHPKKKNVCYTFSFTVLDNKMYFSLVHVIQRHSCCRRSSNDLLSLIWEWRRRFSS